MQAYEHPQETMLEMGRWINDFGAGVWKKGVVRPVKQIAQLTYLIVYHPDVVRKAIGKAIVNLGLLIAKQEEMVLARRYYPGSEETQRLVNEFRREWVDPFDKSIAAAAKALWEMPRKEKAEKVVALLVQMLGTKYLGKLAEMAVAEAKLFGIDVATKLGELGMPPTIGAMAGGGPAISIPAAIERAVPVVKGIGAAVEAGSRAALLASEVVFLMERPDAGGGTNTGLAKPDVIKNYSPDMGSKVSREGALAELEIQALEGTEIADNFLQAVKDGKPMVTYCEKVLDKTTFLGTTAEEIEHLKEVFWEVMGGEDTLIKLGLEGAEIDSNFIAHFTSPEIRTTIKRSGRVTEKMSGGHVLNEELIKKGIIRIEQAENGLFDVHWHGGVDKRKSFFPAGWSKEKAVREVAKSLKEVAKSMKESAATKIRVEEIIKQGTIPTISDEGFEILIGIGKDKRFTTAYPN